VPAALHRLDQAQLLLRGDPCEHRGALDSVGEVVVVELGEFGSGQHGARTSGVGDPDLLGDGAGGGRVAP